MASSSQETLDLVERTGVVAIIRLNEASHVRGIVDALLEGGVRALEITMSVPGAIGLIAQIAPTLPAGFRLGAGTVLDAATAISALDAGATFIVTPVLQRDVIRVCVDRRVPVMPGCFTPTEIFTAFTAGARIVKVFPATSLGPGFLKDIHGPLPQLKLMPTGGVSLENAAEWIRAGAVAVGIGGALLDKAAIAAGNYAVIRDRATRLIADVAEAKAGRS
ncbi:MAG: bifunctional 4-hydroxy-2-oxoglutarate aldolase/2-dehydro-3-deoxy-phosphogluconate aldolase [Vicinamibacterales bacterium]